MSPRLTIIGFHFAPEPTGIAPYTTYLARHLVAAGWTVTVVTGSPHYPQWHIYDGYEEKYRHDSIGGAEVLYLRHYVPRVPRLLNRVLMETHFGLRACRVDWRDPDVVLFVSPALFSCALTRVVARVSYRNARTAVWVQDIYARGLKESHASAAVMSAPVMAIEKWMLSSVDEVFVIHERFLRHMRNVVRLPESRVRIIRNWSHIRHPKHVNRAAVRRRFGWAEDDFVVLHAGNMGVKQDLGNVVEAARQAERRGSKAFFVLLGDGNQRDTLEAQAAGIARIEFIDPLPQEEFSAVISAADVLLVNERPGMQDMAVPSKLTSYFTTGCPVLAAVEAGSTTAGEVELSRAGEVVRSGDPGALLSAVEDLASNPESASRMGANGPRFVANYLSPESAVKHWDMALRALLKD